MLSNGKSAAEIYKVLYVVKRFREFLPKEAPKSQFKIPTAIQLGKRNIPERSTVNTLDNYIAKVTKSTASSTMAKALKDADDVLEQMEVKQTSFNLPQYQKEDYERSAFEDEAAITLNQKDKSDQIMFKHDALQAIAIAKAKEVLVGIDEFSEEAKSEDPEEDTNMCNKSSTIKLTNHFEPTRKAKTVVPSKKRDDKFESKSLASRTMNGRFEAKYKVGDKTASGSIIKEVNEEEWYFIEKDKKGNGYYKCLKCQNAMRVRKDDRKKHSCHK